MAPLNLGPCSSNEYESEEYISPNIGWFGDKFNFIELDESQHIDFENNKIRELPCYGGCECDPSCVAPDYIQKFFDTIPEYGYFVVDTERHIIAHPAKSCFPTLHEYTTS